MNAQYTDGQQIGTLNGQPVRIRQYDRLVTCEDLDPETDTFRLCSRERLEAGGFKAGATFHEETAVLATEEQLRQFGLRGGYNPAFKKVYKGNRSRLHSPTNFTVRPW